MSDLRRQGFSGDRYEDYVEYIRMHYIKNGETPTEWKNRIWCILEMKFPHLFYFIAHKIGERHIYNGLKGKLVLWSRF